MVMEGITLFLGAGGCASLYWAAVRDLNRPKILTKRRESFWQLKYRDLTTQARRPGLKWRRFLMLSMLSALVTGLIVMLLTKILAMAVLAGLFGLFLPYLMLSAKAKANRVALRQLWPEILENIISGVKAGMGLGQTLMLLAQKPPKILATPLQTFASNYSSQGNLDEALAKLKDDVADPVADRIIEALRLAADLGSTQLSPMLESLTQMVRLQARTRAELEARQSWSVAGARLAVLAPWVVLAFMSLNAQSVEFFRQSAGISLLIIGAGICILAYLAMRRLGALPEEFRTLR